MKRPEQRYIELYKEMADLCEAQGWGDPFSYARSKEVYASIELGHKVASTLSGADGFNQKNEPCEYKSTIAGKVKETFDRYMRPALAKALRDNCPRQSPAESQYGHLDARVPRRSG